MAAPLDLPGEEKIRVLTADPNLTPEEANRNADLFLRAERHTQAMMFLERSRDPGRLGRVKQDAIRLGDAFLLHWIARLAPDLVTGTEWKEAGDRARGEGKLMFARDCYEKAGDAEKAQEVRAEWLKIFPPPPAPPPQGPPA